MTWGQSVGRVLQLKPTRSALHQPKIRPSHKTSQKQPPCSEDKIETLIESATTTKFLTGVTIDDSRLPTYAPVRMASSLRQEGQRQQQPQTQTQVQTTTPTTTTETQAILRLRGAHVPNGRSVTWSEDVVDNEGLGRKSSKVCCIYHRPKAVDESSDDSSSSDSSSSDSDSDSGHDRGRRESAQPSGSSKGKKKSGGHDHDCNGHGDGRKKRRGDKDGGGSSKRKPSPNAYERVPKPPKPKDENPGTGK